MNIQPLIIPIDLYISDYLLMVKNCKAKGTKLEHDFRDYFTKWGYLVHRAAGSFGIDLIALKKDYKPVLINVKWKRVYCGPVERKELLDDANRIDGIAVLAFKYIPKNRKLGKHAIQIIRDVKSQASPILLGSLRDQPDYPPLLLWLEGKQLLPYIPQEG